jgi:hypothetical protein
VFDAIDAQPWVGAQLARAPWTSAMLDIFERIGRSVQALGVPYADQFTSASTLVNYILAVGSQNAANARMVEPGTNRLEFLAAAATVWAELDATSTRSRERWQPLCATTTIARSCSLESTSTSPESTRLEPRAASVTLSRCPR